MALLMRAQLAQANHDFITQNAYNQLFTMHGTTMVFLFVVPILAGFGNYLVPLMIGAKDMAFPRLNALSYWLFLARRARHALELLRRRRRRQLGLDGLLAALDRRVQPRDRPGPLDPRPPSDLALLARGRDQLHRHDPQHAHAGDDLDAHPALRLVDRGLRGPARARAAGHLRRSDDAPPRPPGGTSFFRPDGARCSTSTCSGSSGTPRSTSWSCPRSG